MASTSIAEIQAAIDRFKAEFEATTRLSNNDNNNNSNRCFADLEPTPIGEMTNDLPLYNHHHQQGSTTTTNQYQFGNHKSFYDGATNQFSSSASQPGFYNNNTSMNTNTTSTNYYQDNSYNHTVGGQQQGTESIMDLIQSLRNVGALPEVNMETINRNNSTNGANTTTTDSCYYQNSNQSSSHQQQWHEFVQPNLFSQQSLTKNMPPPVNENYEIVKLSDSYQDGFNKYPDNISNFNHKDNTNKKNVRKAQQSPIKKKKTTTKKKKSTEDPNAVLPALSPYNFFFREQRAILIEVIKEMGDNINVSNLTELAKKQFQDINYTQERKKQLLEKHWFRDRTKRRRHRKTFDTIDFTMLSKVISGLWRTLSNEGRDFYQDVASDDMNRYNDEMRKKSTTKK